jgi:DNA-binding Lrp family transcriptional regulator
MDILDETDRKIVEFLTKNSQASLRTIAKELGLSTDTIMRRYQKLEKTRVIQPTIRVNLAKLGYEAFAFFGLKVASQGVLRQTTDRVGKIPDIVAVMETSGDYDLTVIGAVRNVRHIFKLESDIARIPEVRRVSIDQLQLLAQENTYPPPPWHNLDITP